MKSHIKSKERVANHGEVLTPQWLVNAMLDLVKQETERIDSRFLEPACGTGNFLAEVLRRKLDQVDKTYRRSQLDFERNLVLAVSSIYGIDILEDNVIECRERLFAIADERYTERFKDKAKEACRRTLRYILGKNIVWGNALTLKTAPDEAAPIVFSEWSLVNGSYIKRRDFSFEALISQSSLRESPLFSDLGEEAFLPEPVAEYPPVHFLNLAEAYD
ncbi:MAG: DNA methyltransferase [Thermoanaerobaculaceae bacterium]